MMVKNMSEKWKEYYTDEQLHNVQKIEVENLKVFIDVCQKLDLEYVVYGGTLLGTEKYQGLIPWDDDIDVALPRDSYEKFCEKAAEVLPEGYFIQTPYNTPMSPFPYTKLRKRGTKYVEYINRNINIESGIYIDIYPIDRIPDNENARKQQFKNVRKWILIYVCRQGRLYDRKIKGIKEGLKNVARWLVCYLLKIFPRDYCMKKIDYYMTMYNKKNTKRYAALNSPNYDNIYENFYPLKKGLFEGIEVMMPGDFRQHLKKRYGDYSKLPAEEERVGHIPYILDCGEDV